MRYKNIAKRTQDFMVKFIFSGVALAAAIFLNGCDNSSDAQKGNILSGKVKIELPSDFTKMPDSLVSKKYPTEQRPEEVYFVEQEHGKVSLAFKISSKIDNDTLPQVVDAMKNQLIDFDPEVSEVAVNGHKAYQIEVNTPNQEDENNDIENIIQLSIMDGYLLISTFNVTSDLEDKYLAQGTSALSSISY